MVLTDPADPTDHQDQPDRTESTETADRPANQERPVCREKWEAQVCPEATASPDTKE